MQKQIKLIELALHEEKIMLKKCKIGELTAVRRSLLSKNSLSLFSATKQKDDDLIILVLIML